MDDANCRAAHRNAAEAAIIIRKAMEGREVFSGADGELRFE
jgi:hypothetical protein